MAGSRRAARLVRRFREHPLRAEVEAAAERYHELPYDLAVEGHPPHGVIDLLYRDGAGRWAIVDFKTDHLRGPDELAQAEAKARPQVERYRAAVARLLGAAPLVKLCFLDYDGQAIVREPS